MEKKKLLHILIHTLIMVLFCIETSAEEVLDIFEEIKNTSKEITMLQEGKELYVFISLSMPKDSLKQLMSQVRQHNGTLLIRGLHEGSFKRTIVALHKVNKEGVNAVIDPTLFEKYNIGTVPTFILKDGYKIDKVSGNVPLTYALELFKAQGETGRS